MRPAVFPEYLLAMAFHPRRDTRMPVRELVFSRDEFRDVRKEDLLQELARACVGRHVRMLAVRALFRRGDPMFRLAPSHRERVEERAARAPRRRARRLTVQSAPEVTTAREPQILVLVLDHEKDARIAGHLAAEGRRCIDSRKHDLCRTVHRGRRQEARRTAPARSFPAARRPIGGGEGVAGRKSGFGLQMGTS